MLRFQPLLAQLLELRLRGLEVLLRRAGELFLLGLPRAKAGELALELVDSGLELLALGEQALIVAVTPEPPQREGHTDQHQKSPTYGAHTNQFTRPASRSGAHEEF